MQDCWQRADIKLKESLVEVARKDRDKAKALLDFATIRTLSMVSSLAAMSTPVPSFRMLPAATQTRF